MISQKTYFLLIVLTLNFGLKKIYFYFEESQVNLKYIIFLLYILILIIFSMLKVNITCTSISNEILPTG